MAIYFGNRDGITPSTSADNWTLDAGSGETFNVKEYGWGGESTSSNAMRTKIARSASGATPVDGTAGKRHANAATNKIQFVTSWGTDPTLDAENLCPGIGSWNSHGGVVRWLAAPGEEIVVTGAGHLSCRNLTGTATSSYGVVWDEE